MLALFLFILTAKFKVGMVGISPTRNKHSRQESVSDLCVAELD